MKKINYIITLILVAIITTFSPTEVILKIKGSDNILPLSQKLAEKYMTINKDAKITVMGGGSGVGIAAFIDGTTDIAMSSRRIKMSEKMKLQSTNKSYKEVVIANDALSIIVHPNNKVKQLTREQLEGIFIGKITNWKDVGGDDIIIVVYSRESSSGTYEFFKESVLKNKNYGPTILMMPATGSIVQSVSQTKGAIGYIGFAYLEKTVKALKISYDNGKTYIEPSIINAKNGSYPIVRPLFYYYLNKDTDKVRPFIDYILSENGQKVITEVGYITNE